MALACRSTWGGGATVHVMNPDPGHRSISQVSPAPLRSDTPVVKVEAFHLDSGGGGGLRGDRRDDGQTCRSVSSDDLRGVHTYLASGSLASESLASGSVASGSIASGSLASGSLASGSENSCRPFDIGASLPVLVNIPDIPDIPDIPHGAADRRAPRQEREWLLPVSDE